MDRIRAGESLDVLAREFGLSRPYMKVLAMRTVRPRRRRAIACETVPAAGAARETTTLVDAESATLSIADDDASGRVASDPTEEARSSDLRPELRARRLRNAEIQRRSAAGESNEALARAFGISTAHVATVLGRRADLPRKPDRRGGARKRR